MNDLLLSIVLMVSLFSCYSSCQGSITQTPSTACVGESITVSCVLTPPDATFRFLATVPSFLIGDSDTRIQADEINTNMAHPVNLTRISVMNDVGTLTRVSSTITLNPYQSSDEGLRLGCIALYALAGTANPTFMINETLRLNQSAPPAPSTLSISSSVIDPNTCSATVSLNWITPSSTDRPITSYYLSLQNGTTIENITATDNSYSHNTTLLLDTVYAYSVSASSCAGNSTLATAFLISNTPPSAPSLQSSVSNFNTATCSADISLSWNTPPSDIPVNRYFLSLDGSPLATTNSNSSIHSTILNINTDYQYSVTAMSCIGNSTISSMSNSIRIASYSLTEISQFDCLAYNNGTGVLTNSWRLSTVPQPSGVSELNISYSLQLLYSHSRQGVTYRYTDSTSFTLPSSQLSYNTVLTAHNFTQLDGVETNITANLTIVQQCGQSFNGTAMECFFDSNNPPIPPTLSTNITAPTVPVNPNNSIGAIVGGIIVGCLFCVIFLTTFLIILAICIFCSKKRATKSHKPAHFGMKECDSISSTHKGPDQYSKAAETTNTNEEMNYAQIDHSMSKGSAVRSPAIPLTNYADIGSFPESTHYTTVNNPN